jgi:two-component system cell cycle response regulator CtrA
MRILYVDDDPSMTKAVELMFRTAGLICDTTDLGERAVQMAQINDYDAIVLDIGLPDIDGYEVIERLRESQVSTPILIQSGLIDRAKADDAAAFGADDILLKPFNKDELISHLERTVSQTIGAPATPAQSQEPGIEAPEIQDTQKRRLKGSRKKIKACEIHFDDSTTSGMVLSLSDHGAVVRLPLHLTNLPKYFTLKFPPGESHDCQICWRAKDKVGIAFV